MAAGDTVARPVGCFESESATTLAFALSSFLLASRPPSACRPMPEAVYGAASLQQPLLSTRWESVACTELGETVEGLPPLERLLRCENEAAFGPIAEALWEAGSDADAEAALVRLAGAHLQEWEEGLRAGGDRSSSDERQAEG